MIQNQARGKNPIIPKVNWRQNVKIVDRWNMHITISRTKALITFSVNISLNQDFQDFQDYR